MKKLESTRTTRTTEFHLTGEELYDVIRVHMGIPPEDRDWVIQFPGSGIVRHCVARKVEETTSEDPA